MRILGILGSPRIGNTEALFEAFADGAHAHGASVESVRLKDVRFVPCKACEACFKTGDCVVEDGFKQIAAAIDEVDALVIATPIHFGGPSALATAFFSRCQQYYARKYVLKRSVRPKASGRGIGIVITTSALDNPDFTECVKRIAGYVLNTLDFEPRALLWIPDMDAPDDAMHNPEALKKAFELGAKVAQRRWDELKW